MAYICSCILSNYNKQLWYLWFIVQSVLPVATSHCKISVAYDNKHLFLAHVTWRLLVTGKSTWFHWGLLTGVFSWKRTEAQEGTELCKCMPDFYSVMPYVPIPLATASPIAKAKSKEDVYFYHTAYKEAAQEKWGNS